MHASYTLCTYDSFHAFNQPRPAHGAPARGVRRRARSVTHAPPDRNHVPFGRLHMAFMQLLGFDMYGTVALPEDNSEVLESVLLRVLRPFEVHFTRVIVTRASVLLVGHPAVSLNHVRK